MVRINGQHRPTIEERAIVKRMAQAGIPKKNIASLLGLSYAELDQHYWRELKHGLDEKILALSDTATQMALNGNEKLLQFLLRTQGYKYGFSEKQVVEVHNSSELEQLEKQIQQLEQQYAKDY